MIGSVDAAFFLGVGTTITVPHWHLALVPAISSDTVCRVLQFGHLNAKDITVSLHRELPRCNFPVQTGVALMPSCRTGLPGTRRNPSLSGLSQQPLIPPF
jgi:hypothetical protein